MSEEEKEAIESVKSMFGNITIEKLIKDKIFNITICSLGILDILRVIAIVDKQQKEIEEKTTILLAGAEKVKQLEKEIEELTLDLEEMTKSNNHKKENWVHKNILNSYISKDKIREKLKKYDKDIAWANADDHYYFVKYINELLEENNE